ncbi:Piso0_001928 [Millerozyma farinosa CBS 7064]|uniref:Piso0_001928 protein n=1 Tax=Pichia sorbitophila (strain ATCC MYA-4447 / BCRC 22081 / CBS 7064 / NBRC 10061 / NRRL Y-12695) TaxID=559304 RepID=G8YB84_PICSO|nr:Piso0_001928 [Millerozyma farinosa CBS 7064]
MASPIFLSYPPVRSSLLSLFRGIELALIGIYRSLKNPGIYRLGLLQETLIAVVVSVSLQTLLRVFLRVLITAINKLSIFRHIESKDFRCILEILNLNYLSVAASRYFTPYMKIYFLESLKYISIKNKSEYYKNLYSLYEKRGSSHHEDELSSSLLSRFEHVLKNSKDFTAFYKKSLKNVLFIFLIVLICPEQSKIGNTLVIFCALQTFNDKLGSIPTVCLGAILSFQKLDNSLLFLSYFWGSYEVTQDLFSVYFECIRCTRLEKTQWIRSREGLLLPFSFYCLFLINKMNWIGTIVYLLSGSCAAYILIETTDVPPTLESKLINWSSSQIIWNHDKKQYFLDGKFIDEDF